MQLPRKRAIHVLIFIGALPCSASLSFAQSNQQKPTTGTTAPSQPVPQPAPQPSEQAPQQSQPSTGTQQAPSKRTSDRGIKVDPVQTVKTIIDIFGKKPKKPQPAPTPVPEAAPAPLPTTRPSEPTVVPPQPAVIRPAPAIVPTSFPPRIREAAKDSPKLSEQPPAQPESSANLPKAEEAPLIDVKPLTNILPPSPRLPTEVAVAPNPANLPTWPIIAAVLALLLAMAAALRFFLFPKVRFDLEFETGNSQMTSIVSPFASLPEAKFEIEYEWECATSPNFTLST